MTGLLYKTVERILQDERSLSRNRNFEAFETAEMKRALRIVKHLRSIKNDLRTWGADGSVHVKRVRGDGTAGATQIELVITHLSTRRVSYLNDEELRLLRQDPELSEMLSRPEVICDHES